MIFQKRAGWLVLGFSVFLPSCGDQTTSSETTTSSATTPATGSFTLSSESLPAGAEFPSRYVFGGECKGNNVSPHLSWSNPLTSNVKSLALTMLDTSFENFEHWIVYNIPTTVLSLSEGASSSNLPTGSVEAPNGFGSSVNPVGSYAGPCPPVGEKHTYQFKIWALDIQDLRTDTAIDFTVPSSVVQGIDRHDVSSAALNRDFTGPP